MRFLGLLHSGASPEFVARKFIKIFIRDCFERDDLSYKVAANFVMDCFQAIGLKLSITEEKAENLLEGFEWPLETMRIYIFKYTEFFFKPFEDFLFEICIEIGTYQSNYTTHGDIDNDEYCCPFSYLILLVSFWHRAYKQLQPPFCVAIFAKYFTEPLARINFQLLRGLNYLRKLYSNDHSIVNRICNRLLLSAQNGIFYEETQEVVVEGLIEMLREDFHLFHENSEGQFIFYYQLLSVQVPKPIAKKYYKSLVQLLKTYCKDYDDISNVVDPKSLIVTNYFVDERMLRCYYNWLVKEDTKNVLIAVLNFLQELQRKLVSIDFFPEAFMRAILQLVVSPNIFVGELAAKVYMDMMKRRSSVELILNSIFESFLTFSCTPSVLSIYVQRLWSHIECVKSIHFFLEPIQQSSSEAKTKRIMAAHFIVIIFNCLIEDYETNSATVQWFLPKLLDAMKSVECAVTQGILLDVFDALRTADFPNIKIDLHQIFILFQKQAKTYFLNTQNLQHPLLRKWFQLWEVFASYTGHLDDIKETVLTFIIQYKRFLTKIRKYNRKLKPIEIHIYNNFIQKLCVISKRDFIYFCNEIQIEDDLFIGLISPDGNKNGIIYEYAEKNKTFIDVYAIETSVICLIKYFNNQMEKQMLEERVKKMEVHLLTWLKDIKSLMEQPIVRIKTLFNSLVDLYIVFGSNPNRKILSLENTTYELLVRILVNLLFKCKYKKNTFGEYEEHTQVHTLRSFQYKEDMLQHFHSLHKCCSLQLTDHYVWHLCFYFGLPIGQRYQQQLHELMLTLIKHHFNIFKRVVPIVIYNLYSYQNALKRNLISKSIAKYKTLIDNYPQNKLQFFNIYVVLSVIDMVEKSVRIHYLNNQRNRLLPLKHLCEFLKNLKYTTSDENSIKTIPQKALYLRKSLLTKEEHKTLNNFLAEFKRLYFVAKRNSKRSTPTTSTPIEREISPVEIQ